MATKVKTLRLPEDVIATVEGFPGDTFTEKFVAAVRLLGSKRESLEKEVKQLENEKQRKLTKLADMNKLLNKRDQVQRELDYITWKISDTAKMCKVLADGTAQITGQDTSNKGS